LFVLDPRDRSACVTMMVALETGLFGGQAKGLREEQAKEGGEVGGRVKRGVG